MDSKKAHREIGFIGLGIMGKPMVKNLLKSGYKVSFFSRRKKVIDEISAIGGIYIKNISDLPSKDELKSSGFLEKRSAIATIADIAGKTELISENEEEEEETLDDFISEDTSS